MGKGIKREDWDGALKGGGVRGGGLGQCLEGEVVRKIISNKKAPAKNAGAFGFGEDYLLTCPRIFGSMMSRSASPTRFHPSTNRTRVIPG